MLSRMPTVTYLSLASAVQCFEAWLKQMNKHTGPQRHPFQLSLCPLPAYLLRLAANCTRATARKKDFLNNRRIVYQSQSAESRYTHGADTPIVCVYRKAFLTLERSRSKPFWAPTYIILDSVSLATQQYPSSR